MASVYAAFRSLARSLHQILDLGQYIDPLHKQILVSLHETVDFILIFLEDYSDKDCGTLDLMGNGIRKAAYEAQDFMDSYLCLVSSSDDDWCPSGTEWDKVSLEKDLNMALERIDFIWEELMKMKNNMTAADHRPVSYSSPIDQSYTTVKNSTTKSMFVGFHDDLNAIKERLYEDSTELQIIPIVGMGGIGKTTLARRAYEDSLLAMYFDICAWITISQEYQKREILSRLYQLFKPNDEQSDESDAQLAKLVYQHLIGRRYLIVIDDIWRTEAWDDLKVIFPDDGSGSRILLTTRLLDVAVHAGTSSIPVHRMDFLDEDQSWKLLQKRIFRHEESCPLHLVEIGKKIARSCGGLPLTIVVVAGILASSDMTKELWENISENISSKEPTIALHCSKILCLSYDRLPLRLKPCFLYITAFPEDYEIDASKLVMLWLAEGFLKPEDNSKYLEDVGERYLEDLVNRSLVFVSQKGPGGNPKTIKIHDLLREICITKAEEEGFLHHVSHKRNAQKYVVESPHRRISIHCKQTFQEWRIQDSSSKSVLLFSQRDLRSELSLSCRRLTILNSPEVTWPSLSYMVSTFVSLRYIAFAINETSCPRGFPTLISGLSNLQTLIAHVDLFFSSSHLQVPYEILSMPQLRHIIMDVPFCLLNPSTMAGFVHESNLQTLDTVVDFRFTEDAIKVILNLRKLKVDYNIHRHDWNDFEFHNLFRLGNLQALQVSMLVLSSSSWVWNQAFPISLKKLVLHGVPLPWENMTIIGSLPNLQILEMLSMKAIGFSRWEPIEGQFLLLKYFRSSLDALVEWEVEKEHFPGLEILILRRPQIDEIPCGIGEIDSLQLIELQGCSESLVSSAKRIQEQQYENGNDTFQVRVNDSDECNFWF